MRTMHKDAQGCTLHAARCTLHAACCMLHAACCMLHAACCMLHAACCMLRVACCMLHVAGGMLHVACFMLHVSCASCCGMRHDLTRDTSPNCSRSVMHVTISIFNVVSSLCRRCAANRVNLHLAFCTSHVISCVSRFACCMRLLQGVHRMSHLPCRKEQCVFVCVFPSRGRA